MLWLLTVHPLDTRLGLAWTRRGLVARCIAGPGKWITGCHFGCLPSAMMTSSDTWERKSWLWLQSKMGSAMIGIGQELWQGWGRWEGEGRHDQAQDWREACIYWSFKSREVQIGIFIEPYLNICPFHPLYLSQLSLLLFINHFTTIDYFWQSERR